MTALGPARSDTRGARRGHIVTPQRGDLVVSVEPGSRGHFTIRQVPGNPTILWNSRAKALVFAQAFARARAVDVWVQHGDTIDRLRVNRTQIGRAPARPRRLRPASDAVGVADARQDETATACGIESSVVQAGASCVVEGGVDEANTSRLRPEMVTQVDAVRVR